MLDKRNLLPFIIGFNGIVIQLLLIRELSSIMYGTEMVLGTILGFWMFGTGSGSMFGNRHGRLKEVVETLTLITILLIPVIRMSRYILNFKPYEVPQLKVLLILILFTVLPFSFLSGMVFPLATKLFKGTDVRKVYLLESIGSFIGGLVFVLLLSRVDHFITITIGVTLYSIALSAVSNSITPLVKVPLIPLLMLGAKFNTYMDRILWYPFHLILVKNSPYQNIVVTRDRDIKSLYGNGELYISYPDPIGKEEFVDPAIVFSEGKDALYIGCDIQIVDELERYDRSVDLCFEDRVLLKTAEDMIFKRRFKNYKGNPLLYIKGRKKMYDIVVGDYPPPYTLHLNRFYTVEFFRSVYGILKRGGIFFFKFPGGENYISYNRKRNIAMVKRTMEDVFDDVKVLPGEELIIIGIKGKRVRSSIFELWNMYGREGAWVNDVYMRSRFSFFRWEVIRDVDTIDVEPNTMLKPGCFVMLNGYMSEISGERFLAYILNSVRGKHVAFMVSMIVVVLILLILWRGRNIYPVSIGISGGTEITMEIIIVYMFQSMYGNAYLMMGIIFSSFMIGLGIGSFIYREPHNKKKFIISEVMLTTYPLLFALLTRMIKDITLPLHIGILYFSLWALTSGIVGGFQFNSATYLFGKEESGITYGADLMGGFVCSILFTFFIIPISGIIASLTIVSLFNLIIIFFILIGYVRRKR